MPTDAATPASDRAVPNRIDVYDFQRISATFDDPNLISCAGLAPVLALAERTGLHDLVAEHVHLPGEQGSNPHLKVPALVAGMVTGADCIDDMDVLRHGGMGRLFDGSRAPSTLGIFLRAFTFGHVRQLDAVAARSVPALCGQAPILPAIDQVAYVDLDAPPSTSCRAVPPRSRRPTGTPIPPHAALYAGGAPQRRRIRIQRRQGPQRAGVPPACGGIATISTPHAAPIIAATRLRRGSTNSARGAARLVSNALSVTKACGATGLVVVRADSAYYNHDVVAAARRADARFSITARMNPSIAKAIATIEEDAWTPIHYPNAIWDEDEQALISDAQVAEVPFTAFTSRKKAQQVRARLIVRRVKRLNPGPGVPVEQEELFSLWRYHAEGAPPACGGVTDSPQPMLQAETTHRAHATIEQVHADMRSGPLAHMPSSSFSANGAWLVLSAIAFNLAAVSWLSDWSACPSLWCLAFDL